MSSFWDNNKGSIMSAGKATAKGIGKGSVAISKGGYNMYKNRGGPGKTSQDSSKDDDLFTPTPIRYDNLGSFAAPPKRNVDAFGKPSGNGPVITQTQPQQYEAQYQAQPAQGQPYQPQPVQAPFQYQNQPAQSPAQAVQPPQQAQIFSGQMPTNSAPVQYAQPLSQGQRQPIPPPYATTGPQVQAPNLQSQPQSQPQSQFQNQPPAQAPVQTQPMQNTQISAPAPPVLPQRLSSSNDLSPQYGQQSPQSAFRLQPYVKGSVPEHHATPIDTSNLASLPRPPVRTGRITANSTASSAASSVHNQQIIGQLTPNAIGVTNVDSGLNPDQFAPSLTYNHYETKVPSLAPLPSRNSQSPVGANPEIIKKVPPPKPAKKVAPPKPVKKIHTVSSDHHEDSPSLPQRPVEEEGPILPVRRSQTPEEKPAPKIPNFAAEIASRTSALNIGQSAKPLVKPKPQIKPKPEAKAPVEAPAAEKPHISNETATIKLAVPKTAPKPEIGNTPRILNQAEKLASPSPPPPPPSRNYSRARAPNPMPQTTSIPDLQLNSGWYALDNFHLPETLQGLMYTTSLLHSQLGRSTNYERKLAIRMKDLAVLKINVKWTDKEYASCVPEVSLSPSPFSTVPSHSELVSSSQTFGDSVASWSENKLGQQVGRGECWDLAHDALQKGCGNHAFVSEYYIHGFPILQIEGSEGSVAFVAGTSQLDEIRRGDIIQFTSCTFFDKSSGITLTVGLPNHTSLVTKNTGADLQVLEQNINNVRKVMAGSYNLKNLVNGKVEIYRPMPKQWSPELLI